MVMVDLERVAGELDRDLVGWLTTVTPSGQPQSSIVWFLKDRNDLLIYSRPDTAKLRNIASNPRVSFLLHSDRYGHSVITMEGEAAIVNDPVPASDVPEYVAKYRERMDEYRWTPESFAADYSVLIRVTVTRLRATG